MPYAPFNTKCQTFGCKAPRSKFNSFCLEHGGKDSTVRDYDDAYKSKAWRVIRQGQLSKQPLCQACLIEGRVAMGVHVDHLFPWRQIGPEAFRRNILQTLCHNHHGRKTAQERRGIIEQYTPDGIKTWAITDYPTLVEVA